MLIIWTKNLKLVLLTSKFPWGREMKEVIWHWTKGDSKIYTRKIDVAEKAMKEGILVVGKKIKPHIIKY